MLARLKNGWQRLITGVSSRFPFWSTGNPVSHGLHGTNKAQRGDTAKARLHMFWVSIVVGNTYKESRYELGQNFPALKTIVPC